MIKICKECKKEFDINNMYGKGNQFCKECYEKRSNMIKFRKNKLIILQKMPLEIKIERSIRIIEDAVYQYGLERTYVSYSGGKDSTVLSHLARSIFPNILHIFSNTTNEYPETLEQINWEVKYNNMNLIITLPQNKNGEFMNFKKVVERYGYPMFSKEVACAIRTYRNAKSQLTKERAYEYIKRNYKMYLPYIELNISDKCCDVLKKAPIKKLEKKLGLKCAIIGTLAQESRRRELDWIYHGCNYQTSNSLLCRPLSFWTEDDIYNYIQKNNIKISKLYSLGYERNGCMFCGFGVHYEGEKNRFIKLKETHPKQYEYLINNFKSILDQCNIKT